jgi:hypothetical protein
MTKPAAKTRAAKPAVRPVAVNRRREWRFDLPLPAVVEGPLPGGRTFKEAVSLENISSTGVFFCMDSGVVVGTRVKITIDIPKEAAGSKKVHLRLGGTAVRLEKAGRKGKTQGVAVLFHKTFKFVAGKK